MIGISEIAGRLRQVTEASGRTVSEEALFMIAEEAAGGLRDALSLLEQVLAYNSGEVSGSDVLAVLGSVGRDVFFSLTDAFLRRDLSAALMLLQDVALAGKDLHHFTQQAIGYYRDLMVSLACGEQAEALGIAPDWALRLKKQATALGMGAIGQILTELHILLSEVRWAARPRLLWELAIIRILVPNDSAYSRPQPALADAASAAYTPVAPVRQELVKEENKAPENVTVSEKKEPLQNVIRMWPRVMDLVKKESRKTHALLLAGEAASCDGNVLELHFEAEIHCEMMDSPTNKKPLQSVLKTLFGAEPSIRCVKAGSSAAAATVEKDPDELISSAVEIFNGQVIDGSADE